MTSNREHSVRIWRDDERRTHTEPELTPRQKADILWPFLKWAMQKMEERRKSKRPA